MSKIVVIVKPTAGGEKLNVNIDSTASVWDLKEELSKQNSIPPAEQRVIYKGQILKDERTLDSYGIGDQHVVHLVRGKPQTSSGAPSSASPANPSPTLAQQPMPTSTSNVTDQLNMMNLFESNPLLQHMMQNPEVLRGMLQSNPAIREVIDRNPELTQVLSDPDLIRQSLQMASNPSLMREQMRNMDRAMANLEAMPEGFNAMRRLYSNVSEPLMNAATAPENATNPFASLFQAMGQLPQTTTPETAPASTPGSNASAAAAPNAAPLPNPWAPSQPSTGLGGGLGLGLGGGLGAGFPGLQGMFGGGPPGPQDMNTMLQIMQNPATQQLMSSMLSQPGMMDSMINSNPQLRNMVNSNPQFRAMMSNPEFIRQAMDPNTIQLMMQLGAMGGAPGAGAAAAPTGAAPPMFNPMDLLSALGGAPGGAPGGINPWAAAAPPADPEVAYSSQLTQLVDMGFTDRAANIRALQASGGNVNVAVERLLSGNFYVV